MDVINIDLLKELIRKIKNHSKLPNSIKQINECCHFQFKYVKPEAIVSTAEKINQRERSTLENGPKASTDEQEISWGFGEFKIFVWVIIYHCLNKEIQLKEIDEEIIHNIQNIFPLKMIHFIKYEIRLLISYKHAQPETWTKQETRIFESIMNPLIKCESINWKLISYKLYTQSNGKYFRNLNHCRQRWNNHLNPIVKRCDWSVQEDMQLFQLIDEFGLKWSKISKCMGHTRTEHMVKNRYNRFLRLWKINKSCSSAQIRVLIRQHIDEYDKKIGKKYKKAEGIKMEQISHSEESNCNDEYQNGCNNIANKSPNNHPRIENIKQQDIRAEEQSFHIQQKTVEQYTQGNQKEMGNLSSFHSIYYPFLNSYLLISKQAANGPFLNI